MESYENSARSLGEAIGSGITSVKLNSENEPKKVDNTVAEETVKQAENTISQSQQAALIAKSRVEEQRQAVADQRARVEETRKNISLRQKMKAEGYSNKQIKMAYKGKEV